MFQFPGFPYASYLLACIYLNATLGEFPHSEIYGSKFICNSPQLFAACHVLLRRLVPRHPSYALISLIVYVDLILENLLRFYVISNMLSFREKSYYFRITIFTRFLYLNWNMQLSMCKSFDDSRMVGSSGLEPPTSRLSGVCSNQLSYEPMMVEVIGFEPMTPCLQGRCSTSWAIPPTFFAPRKINAPPNQWSNLFIKNE